FFFFFFKQKTAYEMVGSDWSSDVCSSDLAHPVSSTVGAGDRWIGEMVKAIMASRYWSRVAVVITYDEGGGWFDHVPPPVVDRFGLGTRVPALIVSPYAKRGIVAHGRRHVVEPAAPL